MFAAWDALESQSLIFAQLKLWVAVARYNFKWAKIYMFDCFTAYPLDMTRLYMANPGLTAPPPPTINSACSPNRHYTDNITITI